LAHGTGTPEKDADAQAVSIPGADCRFERLAGFLPIHRARVDASQWWAVAQAVASAGGRLIAHWGTDRRTLDGHFAVAAAYALPSGLYWVDLPLVSDGAQTPTYPDISTTFYCATRMQRALFDLCGVRAEGAADTRPWLAHGAWPTDYFPLTREPSGRERFDATEPEYAFVPVEGDGVHEIPVGPVHAGIIEPGHFRFSVVGEKILRLEERLGYVHKGIEKRFEGMAPLDGVRLAARVSGDSTVAYGWAYAGALESACALLVPARAQWLRALALERERVGNHLGDLGALGNDAGLAIALAQFSRLRENWLRQNFHLCGHRLLMDWIVPGGMAVPADAAVLGSMATECDTLEREVALMQAIFDEHAGLQDRFAGAGRLTREQAGALQLTGMAARASGLGSDLREEFAFAPYDALHAVAKRQEGGDVAARVALRFAEVQESLRLIRAIVRELPHGPVSGDFSLPAARAVGAGWVEGWRGEVFVALELDERGRILRAHCHDPSWQNWPALEHAVIGNIVPDFPLINKSFNLSYSGVDL
jgi:Ni,Fe-hydrogenase III large subunit/Ni,Fe-hydrogenase III component G